MVNNNFARVGGGNQRADFNMNQHQVQGQGLQAQAGPISGPAGTCSESTFESTSCI